jgi:hypothetical protein
MININSLLKEYRDGDFEKRLSLFLNYRDIRKEFVEIDEADMNGYKDCSADKGKCT